MLRERSDRVFAVGVSMGGLLSLLLAAEERLDAVAVIGVPLRFSRAIRWSVPIARYVMPYREKKEGSDIQDDAARARHPGMSAMPLASVHELVRLQRRVAAGLPKITIPILAAHGALDRTAAPVDASRILANVNSGDRELHLLERSGHVVPVDHDGPKLAVAIADFFTRQIA